MNVTPEGLSVTSSRTRGPDQATLIRTGTNRGARELRPRRRRAMPSRDDVRRTYDRIAPHFSKTRPEPWPEVSTFLEDRSGSTALDIGVGNGRHAALLADRARSVLGLDFSRTALAVARDRLATTGGAVSLILGDASRLPIASDAIDLVVYVATIHHLPTRSLRVRSLNELDRVMSPGGEAIVSAWSTSHPRFDRQEGFDTEIAWTLPDGTEVPRYYHIYDVEEFAGDLAESALGVREVFESHGNCWATVTVGA